MADVDNQLNQALTEMISKANDGIDSATGFLQAQIPDVVQQLLIWKMSESLLLAFFSLTVLIGGRAC